MFSRLKRCFSDNRSICFVSIILTGIILNSCSISYKFNGSSLDYTKTKTITITDFPNNATLVYPQLAPKLNTALKDIFNRRTKLQQVRRNGDMTRVQRERFTDLMEYEKVKNVYTLKSKMLENTRDNLRILHPLPRVTEIDYDVDDSEKAYYFDQAQNGLYVRQAVISHSLGLL